MSLPYPLHAPTQDLARVYNLRAAELKEATDEVAAGFIPEEHRVDDLIGLGRIPTAWWTLNCKYNDVYDIHRLNVRSQLGRRAVDPHHARLEDVRFEFVRSAPDLATMMVALRTELSMRVVMPALMPSSAASPYLTMARFETGGSGNPHWHGFSVAGGAPRLLRVRGDAEDGKAGDEPPGSESGEDSLSSGPIVDSDSGSESAGCGGDGASAVESSLAEAELGRTESSPSKCRRLLCRSTEPPVPDTMHERNAGVHISEGHGVEACGVLW